MEKRFDMDRKGFAMSAVIIALVVLSAIAVASVLTGSDERRAARAMRAGAEAFYAAEAGRAEVPSIVADSLLAALASGDSLDLGWRDLDYGGSYHAVIQRLDAGGDVQTLYTVRVEGRGAGASSGQRVIGDVFTFSPYPVMDALFKIRGQTRLYDESLLSGVDEAPAEWLSAGVCDPGNFADVAGIKMEDMSDLQINSGSVQINGAPASEEDTTIADSAFDNFGGPTWDDLIAIADFEIGVTDQKFNPEIRPSYNPDGTCKTNDPYNWGSNDPNDPCFDHFPVIHLIGKGIRASLGNGYGQAFIIADSEFDIQASNEAGSPVGPGAFAGIVLGRGCLEFNLEQTLHGAIIWDRIDTVGCSSNEYGVVVKNDVDPTLSPDLHYSSCVIDRTLKQSAVGSLFGWHREGGRPYTELFR